MMPFLNYCPFFTLDAQKLLWQTTRRWCHLHFCRSTGSERPLWLEVTLQEQREWTTEGLKNKAITWSKGPERFYKTWHGQFFFWFNSKKDPLHAHASAAQKRWSRGRHEARPVTHRRESAVKPIGARYLETVRPEAPLLTGGSLLQVAGLQRYQRETC